MALSNHQQMQERGRQLFLCYDQSVMISRFQLTADEHWMHIPFIGCDHRISRGDGHVERLQNGAYSSATFGAAMSIYDLLCRAKPHARPSGLFGRIGSLNGKNRTSNPNDSLFQRSAVYFEQHPDAFSAACGQLGGKPVPIGDIAFQINTFDFLPFQLRLWLSDDEFPADLQILCDENLLDFVCFETAFYMAGELLNEVKNRMF